MPETFLLSSYEKSQVHEFILIARKELEFKVDILIKDKNLLNLRYAFLNSASVEVVNPYRADFNKATSFFAKISSDEDVALPTNLPELDSEKNSPDYWLQLGSIRGNKTLSKHLLESGRNLFNPASLYWGNTLDYVSMPYLPFFSNCKGFDKYIPIFSIFEQNPGCDLVMPNETKYIKTFGFGSEPKADECKGIQLECIYDEDLDQATDSPKWYEEGPSTLFYMSKIAYSASNMDVDDINLKTENVRDFISKIL